MEHFAAHHLVAGLHVRQHRVVEDVGEQREHTVAEVVREQEHAVAAEEPRAVDDVGAPVDDQLGELGNSSGEYFEVGVLDRHHVAGDRGEAAPQRRALALIALLQQQREAVLALQLLEALARAVGRAVVDDDQLDATAAPPRTRGMISSIVAISLKTGITTERRGDCTARPGAVSV